MENEPRTYEPGSASMFQLAPPSESLLMFSFFGRGTWQQSTSTTHSSGSEKEKFPPLEDDE